MKQQKINSCHLSFLSEDLGVWKGERESNVQERV